jgi:hypothetical protein
MVVKFTRSYVHQMKVEQARVPFCVANVPSDSV